MSSRNVYNKRLKTSTLELGKKWIQCRALNSFVFAFCWGNCLVYLSFYFLSSELGIKIEISSDVRTKCDNAYKTFNVYSALNKNTILISLNLDLLWKLYISLLFFSKFPPLKTFKRIPVTMFSGVRKTIYGFYVDHTFILFCMCVYNFIYLIFRLILIIFITLFLPIAS